MNHIISAAILTAIVAISCSSKKEEAADASATAAPVNAFYVRTAPISTAQLNDVIHVTGVIQSDTEAKPAFKTGGVIARTYVKEGDRVRKGQLLARLIMTEIEAQATQAKFALEKAERDRTRVQNLYNDSIATLEQLQNATTAVDMAKKSLQIADFNVAYSEVRSPIEGKVVQQLQHEGEIVGPGIPVYYIIGVRQADWKLVAGLTDKNWGRVRVGNPATISLDAYPDLTLQGKVKRLSDVANPLSGTFDAEISIPSKDNRVAAGMLAHVQIQPAAGNPYPVIPIEALVSSNGSTGKVFVPHDGKAQKRSVRIHQFDGESVSISAGLEGVTDVITAGSEFLEEGDAIIVEENNR